MRLAFMGSPDFALPALAALIAAGHEIAAVYCQPARPAGRGQALRPCPVEVAARAAGIPVHTPVSFRRDAAARAEFAALQLDAAVVAAYGLILPTDVLRAPRMGCLNIHASLLPRWRGAAPIQAAILAGDAQSGVTIMQMDEGLDTGAILRAEAVPIDGRTTGRTLHDALAPLGARLIVSALADAPTPVPQPAGATYAAKLTRSDGRLDWAEDAVALARRVRAFDPWPGCFAEAAGETLKILAAEPAEITYAAAPGVLLDDHGLVACGTGGLRLLRLQRPGRAALAAADFFRGAGLPRGFRFT